ncbi:non-hydrolyzing UDP-N-acetylglucosamine 2-epimerase [Pseudothermotoga thermarum]|uniref:UDP-N-acetylglucosamine 2-epimerase n=1 Tax=Pseudothermotoga thermarum DSM 5069 TaxID=688269 RepID=F7YVK5_9THEM|nr:UDP-N-acetylglucosamine 2-epimerase (non-hydrolyzing) [Pseudothermotoga thermarum]AEH51661.1 UDP-N-acetylglucosamine 2-epimerase [Pseudothermotoga thermarum DSM 5069]
MRVLSLVGARPQFIKEAVVQEELQKAGIQEILVHSGQHYDYNMSDVFFEVLRMKEPDYNLNVGSGLHGEVTGKIMIEFEKVVLKEKPDVILVYGDTNTTLAGALVGAKLKIPVAHVEAGIRQKPKDMPEEINRVVTDHVSKLLFCPSQLAVKNLEKEGITEGVYFVGDVMYDLFLKMKPFFDYSVLGEYGLKENEYIVCTIHRDFNTDNRENLEAIVENLNKISKQMQIVFPVHPRTKKMLEKFGLMGRIEKGVLLLEPLDYLKMMGLVEKSSLVITDSGGLQKEAYFCGKRAIVVMPDTGWRELVEIGWNRLSSCGDIYKVFLSILTKKIEHFSDVYGNGESAKRIVEILLKM